MQIARCQAELSTRDCEGERVLYPASELFANIRNLAKNDANLNETLEGSSITLSAQLSVPTAKTIQGLFYDSCKQQQNLAPQYQNVTW